MPHKITDQAAQIAIIGGGIGGLVFAVGLARNGVPFHIYEAAAQFSEIGAGVGFALNAQRAMHMIDPRIKEGYDRNAALNFDDRHKEHFFQFRLGMDGLPGTKTDGLRAGHLISEPGGPGKGMSMIHRARFLEELIALLPEGCVSFGKRLDRLEHSDKGVKLFFGDNTTAEADAAIGCDGVKSNVRKSIFGDKVAARFTGKYAYRGLLPMQKLVDLLGEARARNSQAYLGYGGHVLTMAVEGGETMNVVAFKTKVDASWEDKTWVLPMRKQDMEQDFATWGDDVTRLLNTMESTDLWAIFDHPRLDTLYSGKTVLLGDAAHASTPHQGSGAAMAIEDALVLSHVLGMTENVGDLRKAFAAYESVRLERSMKLVETSRECGDVYQFLHPDTQDDVVSINENLSRRYDWIRDGDLTEQIVNVELAYRSAC